MVTPSLPGSGDVTGVATRPPEKPVTTAVEPSGVTASACGDCDE